MLTSFFITINFTFKRPINFALLNVLNLKFLFRPEVKVRSGNLKVVHVHVHVYDTIILPHDHEKNNISICFGSISEIKNIPYKKCHKGAL